MCVYWVVLGIWYWVLSASSWTFRCVFIGYWILTGYIVEQILQKRYRRYNFDTHLPRFLKGTRDWQKCTNMFIALLYSRVTLGKSQNNHSTRHIGPEKVRIGKRMGPIGSWKKDGTCWILRAMEDVWWGCSRVLVITSSPWSFHFIFAVIICIVITLSSIYSKVILEASLSTVLIQHHDPDRDHHHDRHLSLKDGTLVGVCLPQNTFHLWSLSSLPNVQDFSKLSKSADDKAHLSHATVFHHRQRPTSRRILKAG